ncbi:cytochrome P450 [Streptomyces sp. NPDC017405]|uniref:cytochrome P450 n=1 Tax=unclassified Streptomyces TaxID=2593676 RepID=UPI0037B2997F
MPSGPARGGPGPGRQRSGADEAPAAGLPARRVVDARPTPGSKEVPQHPEVVRIRPTDRLNLLCFPGPVVAKVFGHSWGRGRLGLDETAAGGVPLAPGGVPFVGHSLRLARGRAMYLQGLRGRGDVVEMRLGRRAFYVLNSPEAIHDVLVTQSGKFSKGMLFDRVRPYIGNGLASSDGPFHLRQRRIVQPAFHRERVARYSEMFVEVAGARVGGWPAGRDMDMGREMRELAVAMLVPALFPFTEGSETGRAIGDLGARVSRDLGVLVRGVLRATILPPALAVVPTPGRRRFLASAAALRRLAESAVRQARSSPENHGVLALLLAHEGGMSDEEACDEMLTFLVAGVETTSTTLSWALHVLAGNPGMADRMSAEARAAEPGVVTPAALPYTARFVHEVLRLYQPLWFMGRRALETVRVGRYEIPRGAEAVYSAATLHRDPACFPDPLRFDPDRWLTRPEKSLPRAAYLPFGAGNRKCIGDGFAWAEMLAVLSAVTTRWHLRPVPGHRVRAVADAQIHPDALPMSVTPRATG